MTGLPKERGSVRYVKFDTEEAGRPREVRVPAGQGLKEGCTVWVEVGGAFATKGTRQVCVPGQWFRCVIAGGAASDSDVHVTLAPLQVTTQVPPEDDF